MAKPKNPATTSAAASKSKRETAKAGTKPTSKLSQLEAMLRRPVGATIPQLVKALDWQAHSVRGAMSGALKKKQGLEITASKAEGKERVYRIAS